MNKNGTRYDASTASPRPMLGATLWHTSVPSTPKSSLSVTTASGCASLVRFCTLFRIPSLPRIHAVGLLRAGALRTSATLGEEALLRAASSTKYRKTTATKWRGVRPPQLKPRRRRLNTCVSCSRRSTGWAHIPTLARHAQKPPPSLAALWPPGSSLAWSRKGIAIARRCLLLRRRQHPELVPACHQRLIHRRESVSGQGLLRKRALRVCLRGERGVWEPQQLAWPNRRQMLCRQGSSDSIASTPAARQQQRHNVRTSCAW